MNRLAKEHIPENQKPLRSTFLSEIDLFINIYKGNRTHNVSDYNTDYVDR